MSSSGVSIPACTLDSSAPVYHYRIGFLVLIVKNEDVFLFWGLALILHDPQLNAALTWYFYHFLLVGSRFPSSFCWAESSLDSPTSRLVRPCTNQRTTWGGLALSATSCRGSNRFAAAPALVLLFSHLYIHLVLGSEKNQLNNVLFLTCPASRATKNMPAAQTFPGES